MKTVSTYKLLPPTFPFNIMEYITKNPPRKAETQWKLMKTCKYFFAKHPIIPIHAVNHSEDYDSIRLEDGESGYEYNAKDFNSKYKWWPDWSLDHIAITSLAVADFLPNVNRCDLKFLTLDTTSITLKEFNFLVASKTLTHLGLTAVSIIDENGKQTDLNLLTVKNPLVVAILLTFLFRTMLFGLRKI